MNIFIKTKNSTLHITNVKKIEHTTTMLTLTGETSNEKIYINQNNLDYFFKCSPQQYLKLDPKIKADIIEVNLN